MANRISQTAAELVVGGTPSADLSQIVVELLVPINNPATASTFNYIKSFPLETSGNQYTVALDAAGTLWVEDVVLLPFTMSSLTPTMIPGSRCFSTTQAGVEYLCFSNLTNGTDIPRQFNPHANLVPTIVIIPSIVTVTANATQQFSYVLTGTTSQAVTWSASAGSVTTGGLYTAPGANGTYSVTVTSVESPITSASAIVTVTGGTGPS